MCLRKKIQWTIVRHAANTVREVMNDRSLWNIPAYLLPRLVLWAINQVKLNQCCKQFYVVPIRFHPQGDRWSVFGMYTQLVQKALTPLTAQTNPNKPRGDRVRSWTRKRRSCFRESQTASTPWPELLVNVPGLKYNNECCVQPISYKGKHTLAFGDKFVLRFDSVSWWEDNWEHRCMSLPIILTKGHTNALPMVRSSEPSEWNVATRAT